MPRQIDACVLMHRQTPDAANQALAQMSKYGL